MQRGNCQKKSNWRRMICIGFIFILCFSRNVFAKEEIVYDESIQGEIQEEEMTQEEIEDMEEEGYQIPVLGEDTITTRSVSQRAFKLISLDASLKLECQLKSSSTAKQLGVKSLKIQQYTDGKWKQVYPSSGSYKNYKTNVTAYSKKLTLAKKQSNKKYRVVATGYAIQGDKTYTKSLVSNTVTH